MELLTPLLPMQVYIDSSVFVAFRKSSVEMVVKLGRIESIMMIDPDIILLDNVLPSELFSQVMLGIGLPDTAQEKLAC